MTEKEKKEGEKEKRKEENEEDQQLQNLFVCLFVGWVLNVPATG